jgi:hypothetical protein
VPAFSKIVSFLNKVKNLIRLELAHTETHNVPVKTINKVKPREKTFQETIFTQTVRKQAQKNF